MIFEFDEHKNEINKQKHKVSFEEASTIWSDPNLVILDARNRGEKRKLAIGKAYCVVYTVVHTQREDRIRIISARRSSEKERRLYDKNSNN